MALHETGFFHHIGTFLLLAATVFLIITDISAPVVDDIGLLKVQIGGGNSGNELSFGTFGYCVVRDGPNACSNSVIGYSPANVVTNLEGTTYSQYATSTTDALTKVMILHPIATGLVFIAFVLALSAGVLGSLLASLVSALAFIVTVVVLICDFVLFSIIKSSINENGNDDYAYYSIGMWTILVSAICSLLGTIVVFLTCCSGRMHRRRERSKVDTYNSPPAATTRRRWWSRRRY